MMNPMAAGLAGALISGVAMYALGANAPQVDAFNQNPALAQAMDRQFVPTADTTAVRPVAAPATGGVRPAASTRRASIPQRTASRAAATDDRDVVRDEDVRPERSWGKTAMIVGGSAGAGAGVGGILGGKKGALIGAAIGGGAASIYEATRR